MSKVEELLAKYNPKGVDIIPLWELTAWDKRFNAVDKSMQKKVIKYKYYLAKDLDALVDDTGDIRILYTNERVAYTSEDKCKGNICEGEIVAIPWGGTPTVKYYYGKFITGDNRIATSLDTNILNNKYLYYWMISQLGTIADFYRGAGIQHPSMISVLSMQIPLPHIKVQEEIVKILDSFTNLIDALNEELSLRQKQFEYYREKLINLKKCSNTKKLQYFVKIMNGKDYKHLGQGLIPLMGSGGIMGHVDSSLYNKESVLLPRKGSIDKVYYIDEPFWTVDTLYWTIVDEKKIIPKFLYYVLSSIHIENYALQGGIPSMTQSILYNIDIPNIDKAIQQSIVEKLDAFESLISSLKEEIELRQKQYEYYREKLLTFE